MKNSGIYDVVIFVGVGMLIGLVWFKVYIQPREAVLYEIMDCMTEKGDIDPQLAYDICSKELKGE
mgnify:CR=1 FL=1